LSPLSNAFFEFLQRDEFSLRLNQFGAAVDQAPSYASREPATALRLFQAVPRFAQALSVFPQRHFVQWEDGVPELDYPVENLLTQ
jgi:hypothetical protein